MFWDSITHSFHILIPLILVVVVSDVSRAAAVGVISVMTRVIILSVTSSRASPAAPAATTPVVAIIVISVVIIVVIIVVVSFIPLLLVLFFNLINKLVRNPQVLDQATAHVVFRHFGEWCAIGAGDNDFFQDKVHPGVATDEVTIEGLARLEFDQHRLANGGIKQRQRELRKLVSMWTQREGRGPWLGGGKTYHSGYCMYWWLTIGRWVWRCFRGFGGFEWECRLVLRRWKFSGISGRVSASRRQVLCNVQEKKKKIKQNHKGYHKKTRKKFSVLFPLFSCTSSSSPISNYVSLS